MRGETRKSAETAQEKIQSILPSRQQSEVEALQAILDFYARPQPQIDFDDHKFLAIQRAIREHKPLNLTYHSLARDQHSQRVVEPIKLVMIDNAWLLTAYCRLRAGMRNFNLARIERYRVLNESFAPHNLNSMRPPEEEFEISVRFEREAVRLVRERTARIFCARGDP